MGLDMYLKAERYISEYDADEGKIGRALAGVLGLNIAGDKSVPFINNVSFNIGYWRKQNAIHNWFVENVQDSEDDCKPYDVELDQLNELKSTCEDVLMQIEPLWDSIKALEPNWENMSLAQLSEPSKQLYKTLAEIAEEHLPTTSGFFFGNIDYGVWYLQGLKDTIETIDKCNQLREENGWYFQYQSSW